MGEANSWMVPTQKKEDTEKIVDEVDGSILYACMELRGCGIDGEKQRINDSTAGLKQISVAPLLEL